MILYNFRHRGPFEYDKFILNTLQFHNEVAMLQGEVFKRGVENKEELLDLKEAFDNYYESFVNDNSTTQQIYNLSLLLS